MDGLGQFGTILAQFAGVTVAVMALVEFLPLFGAGAITKRAAAVFYAALLSIVAWALNLITLPDLVADLANLTAGQRIAVELAVVAVLSIVATAVAGKAHDMFFPNRSNPAPPTQ